MNNTEKSPQRDHGQIIGHERDLVKRLVFKNGEVLFCNVCNILVSSDKKTYMEHLRTQKHLDNFKELNEMKGAEQTNNNSNVKLLNKYVLENSEVLETDGKELFCKICKKSISFETKNIVHQHLTSKKHNKTKTDKSTEAENRTRKNTILAAELLNKYVSENTEVFETDGELLFCKVCKKPVNHEKKYLVDQHLKTQKHKYFHALSIEKTSGNISDINLWEEKDISLIWKKNEDFCRTCMKQFSKAKHKDYKQNISEIPTGCQNNTSIMELLEVIQPQIKVEIKDNLPTLMCSNCIQKLLLSYEFIKMYQNVDKKLRKMLEEYEMENCSNNSEEPQQQFLEEMEVPVDFEVNKYQIEQINIDSLKSEPDEESDNIWSELKDKPKQELSDGVENKETGFSQPNSDDSGDDWIPDKHCPNGLPKEHDSDDVTKQVFKGFYQPEKNDDGTLTCQLCESVLNGVKQWREHIRQQHLAEKPKRAYNRTKPREKRRNQTNSKKVLPNKDGLYPCEYCEKSYPQYSFYRRHLRKHTEEPHLCIECGKSFPLLGSLNLHMLRHKGEKTFVCSHCPKSFVCASGLYNHEMTHANIKPYVCDTCGSAFHMAYELKKHNRIHAGVRKYKCEYCDMRFITGEKQRRHMRTHTGEKPYSCKYCEKAFAQSNDCVKHLRQHLGDNVYQCDLCPLRFPLLREMRVHFASHKNDDEETRARNLQARMEAEKNLQIKLGTKESV